MNDSASICLRWGLTEFNPAELRIQRAAGKISRSGPKPTQWDADRLNSRQGSPNFPVMARRIEDSAQPPAVAIGDRDNLLCARRDGAVADQLRIFNNKQHPN